MGEEKTKLRQKRELSLYCHTVEHAEFRRTTSIIATSSVDESKLFATHISMGYKINKYLFFKLNILRGLHIKT